MALFVERGYEQTTVADIAERAGLTARTFFRYFADKREVLFAGSEILRDEMLRRLADAADSVTPMEAVAEALDGVARLLVDRDLSRKRQEVIEANVELRERELVKLDSLGTALRDGLRRRGIREADAQLAAEAAIAVFRVSFERWVHQSPGTRGKSLAAIVRTSFAQLSALTAEVGVSV